MASKRPSCYTRAASEITEFWLYPSRPGLYTAVLRPHLTNKPPTARKGAFVYLISGGKCRRVISYTYEL